MFQEESRINRMFQQLEDLVRKYEDITRELSEPGVAADQTRFRTLMKTQSDLQELVTEYGKYRACLQTIEESELMLTGENDPEMQELLKTELQEAKATLPEIEQHLKLLLLPKDPNDDKNVIVEIRAGVGGDEAALFASNLYRMYTRYAERRHWSIETMSVEDIGIGGMKSVSFLINGQGAWSKLKYESGVHRVQRVPETESGGRIHPSTATVAIMPEVEDVAVEIDMNDCRFDV